MIVLFDADSLIWSSCYAKRELPDDPIYNSVEKAIQKFDEVFTGIINTIEETYELDKVLVFANARGNFRKQISKTYKANRVDREIPEALNQVQDHVKNTYDAISGVGVETDDVVATYWDNLKNTFGRDEVLILSIDKDYKQLPCIMYDYYPTRKCFYNISEAEARRNFYTQMIVGDNADNVNFCKGYGIKFCEKLFKDDLSEYSYLRMVYTIYKKIYKSKARERFLECYLLLKLKTK